jgi:hypothetical protein
MHDSCAKVTYFRRYIKTESAPIRANAIFMTHIILEPMVRIRLVGIVLLLLIASLAQGQYVVSEDTVPNYMRRNLIYADMSLFVRLALEGESPEREYTMGYKRLVAPNKRFHAAMTYKIDESSYQSFIGYSDTTTIWFGGASEKKEFIGQVGMEWGAFTEKISAFYGLNVLLGMEHLHSDAYMRLGSSYESSLVVEEGEGFDTLAVLVPTLASGVTNTFASSSTRKSLIAGVSFQVGLRVQFKPRWEAWAFLSPTIVYRSAFSHVDGAGTEVAGPQPSSLDFRLNILKLGLAYHL